MRSLIHQLPLARNSVLVFGTHVGGVLLAYGAQVLMVRWAGTDAFGLFSMAFAVASTLSIIAGTGLPDAVVRLLPEYAVNEQADKIRQLVDASERGVAGLGLGLATATTAAVLLLYNGLPPLPSPGGATLLGAWTLTPALVLHTLYTNICRAQGQFLTAYGLARVGRQLLLIAGLGAIAISQTQALSGTTLVAVMTGSLLVVTAMQRVRARQQLPDAGVPRPSPEQYRTWVRFALPFFFTHGFFALFLQTDLLLVGMLAPLQEVGHYRIAIHTASAVSFVLAAVNTVAAPRFAAYHAGDDIASIQRLTRTLIPWIAGLSFAGFLVLIAAGPIILSLFGPSFQAAYAPLVLLAGGHLFSAFCGPVDTLLYMTGHQRTAAWIIGASVGTNLALSIAGLLLYGLIGAAAASALCMVAWNVAFVCVARRRLGVDPSLLALRPSRSP